MPKTTVAKKPAKAPVVKPVVPLSEAILEKDASPRSAQECCEILRKMAESNPTKVISRNFFRVYSPIAESVWNAHFGTFHEFKRQAGIVLTRQQHNLEKEIAKHASVDHYRKFGAERLEWGGKYLFPREGRWKTLLFASDLHDKEIDPFFLRVFLDVAKRLRPDVAAIVGDLFDLTEFGKYTVDPREWDPSGRIKFAHNKIIGPLREACPDSQIDVIEGNHEGRLLRHLADATPALRTILADLHGMTLSDLFALKKFQVNYVAAADLAAYTKRDFDDELAKNYRIYFDTVMAHHFPYARDMGMPGVNGHHHKHIVWSMFNPQFKAYEWHQMGAGHKRHASYCEGEKWHNGFAICYVDTVTRATTFDYIAVTDFAVAGGKFYHRTKDEVCVPGQVAL